MTTVRTIGKCYETAIVRSESHSDSDLAAQVGALGLDPLVEVAGEVPVYLVGGAVRDLLLGHGRTDVDVAVEGDAIALARKLGGPVREHERFGTAKVEIGNLEVDLAATRAERYPRPGALPEVEPASLADDLARRDFTINAIAVPLREAERLIDPHGGRDDLMGGLLRVLHEGSFRDDPTRALRAARYAARFGFELDAHTEKLLRESDLRTVSAERIESELLRLAAEPQWDRGFELLEEWELAHGGDRALMAAVREVLSHPLWGGVVPTPAAVLGAGAPVCGSYSPPPDHLHLGRELAELPPGPPSRLASAARDATPQALVVGRALGAQWLDDFLTDWRAVRLQISGQDLLEAGIPQGPAVGRGLAAALEARLDEGLSGRDEELRVALEAARRTARDQ